MLRILIGWMALGWMASAQAEGAAAFDAAAAFGARPSVSRMSLSPDGTSIAYVVPGPGQSAVLLTMRLDGPNPTPVGVVRSDGKPFRLQGCEWVAATRLVCAIYGLEKVPGFDFELMPFTRIIAVDVDGKNQQVLSTGARDYSVGIQLGGGEVLDLLPEEDGVVLMSRSYNTRIRTGSHLGSDKQGLGVDRIDTRTLKVQAVEPARADAVAYLGDGRGNIRILGSRPTILNSRGQQDSKIVYYYRTRASRDWLPLSEYDELTHEGFRPAAVDPDLDVAFGYEKKEGRLALFKISLDGSLHKELVYERPDVDVGSLIQIGRRRRVVGVHYVTERGHGTYFDSEIETLRASLARALPQQPIVGIVDSSVDESKLLVVAGSDKDPGLYYLLDRKSHHMQPLLAIRESLDGVALASVRDVEYPAKDGTKIPAYLTLPPGHEKDKGLAAIVMPHGGPSARDVWGFDWLAQYFANRGFAVLQPNFRGSTGYGDAWFEKNGFQSWPIAVGDILDGGRWLAAQGIADPTKLAIVGWSYGGYAALQSAVVDPAVFKAVIAIAPVTDLAQLKEEHRHWSDWELMDKIVGEGPHLREGSPLQNAARIQVPVLLFHGTLDRNVGYAQSKNMAAALSSSHGRCELVTFEDLDHQLDDSAARAQMLRKTDAFLRQSLGIPL